MLDHTKMMMKLQYDKLKQSSLKVYAQQLLVAYDTF